MTIASIIILLQKFSIPESTRMVDSNSGVCWYAKQCSAWPDFSVWLILTLWSYSFTRCVTNLPVYPNCNKWIHSLILQFNLSFPMVNILFSLLIAPLLQTNRSMEFLQTLSRPPFLMLLAPPASHSPWTAAPHYESAYSTVKAPRNGSFNVPGKVSCQSTGGGQWA